MRYSLYHDSNELMFIDVRVDFEGPLDYVDVISVVRIKHFSNYMLSYYDQWEVIRDAIDELSKAPEVIHGEYFRDKKNTGAHYERVCDIIRKVTDTAKERLPELTIKINEYSPR